MKNVDSTVEAIKNKYAPDKRVAIFDIETEVIGSSIKLTGETNIKSSVDELLNEIKKLNFSVENHIEILPEKGLGEKIYGIINLSVANLRSNPKHPAELATQSLLGTCVNVLKKENGWYLIQTPDQYIAWVDDDGVYLVNENEQKSWKSLKKGFVTEQYCNAYAKPSDKSQKISDLVAGNIVKILKDSEKFVKIEFPDGRVGFVKSNYIADYNNWFQASEANQKTIINTAKNFIGLPYLWGGTSLKGVDCSGFTKTAYYLNGVILPRDASQQVHVGELVDTQSNFDNLLPGDLLFFGTKNSANNKERITHVGIYLGKNEFIHSSGRVKIDSFDKNAKNFNSYRLNSFIRAKRIIGNFDSGQNLIKNNLFYN